MKFSKILPDTGYVRLPKVLEVFPVGRSTFLTGVKEKKYPQPVKLSKRCTAWKVEDIRALLNSFQCNE